MRIRTIKPDFYTDEDLTEFNPLTRILFSGLWGLADSEGRLEYRPKFIKVHVLPYDTCEVIQMLEDLNNGGFLQIYEVSGREYIQVTNFEKHQRISGKEALIKSEYPAPPMEKRMVKKRGSTWEAPGKHLGSICDHPESQEGKGRERKGKESNATNDVAIPEAPQHVRFVEGFQSVYQELTGSPFKIDQKHWVIASNLVKQYGYEPCVAKVKVLGVLCRDRAAWFTKEGLGAFNLETLSSRWNNIIPQAVPLSKEEELKAELKKREESRVRSDAIVNGSAKISNRG